ncbi:MAG TPA: CYTH domain-containing protein [Ktedonobacteraceae bacterium]|nr:CYTH domain-containing protein [Ktedonobacteraceae bacterium]
MIEIELKCELSPQLLDKVREKTWGMKFNGTVHNQDIYYDTSTWDLLRQAFFVRVRNNRKVEFKFSEDITQEHGQVHERVFSLEAYPIQTDKINTLFTSFLPTWVPAVSFEEAVKKNGLLELVTIDNTREAYASEDITLSIDHVKGLGSFLEVETHCEEGADTSQAQARLQAFVSNLDVQHIKVGYVELWLYKYNPAAYRAGRYHLTG